MNKKMLVLFIILLSSLLVDRVEAEDQKKQVVLVIVPDLSFKETHWLLKNGNSQHLWTSGVYAGVNVRPDGPYSYLNNVVSLSTGSRGLGVLDWNAFERGEIVQHRPVEQLVEQWTGKSPKEAIIHPLLYKLKEKNEKTTYHAQIGTLGQRLKENEVARFVLGNSDKPQEKVRYGSLFTIDELGETSGELVGMTKDAPNFPSGIKMDVDVLVQEVNAIENTYNRSFVVIEWGDAARLFNEKQQMEPTHFKDSYEEMLLELEHFILRLYDGKKDILLLSPMMHQEAYVENERLAPMWLWFGNNLYQQGGFILSSDTTRQAHIVSNVDIAPFILHQFGIEKDGSMIGNPLKLEENRGIRPEQINQHMEWLFTIFESRSIVLSSYITMLVLLLITVSVMLWRNRANESLRMAAKILLVAALSSPFWLLVTAKLLAFIGVAAYFWSMTLLAFLTGFLIVKYISSPLFFIGTIHFISISIDLVLGSPFMQRSFLGYDPIIGARYYGIGNEYAGVFIISSLFIFLPVLKKQRWIQAMSIMLLISLLIYLLGASQLGTNAGATLAAGIAGGFLFYQAIVKNKSYRKLLFVFTGVLIALLILLFMMQLFGTKTHIGYAFERLLSGDISFIVETIKRKLAMNWKIFKFSNWTQLFVTSYVLVGILLWRQKSIVKEGSQKVILQSGIVASIALLLLNDSGVVAAATSMFLIVSASLYWILDGIPYSSQKELLYEDKEGVAKN